MCLATYAVAPSFENVVKPRVASKESKHHWWKRHQQAEFELLASVLLSWTSVISVSAFFCLFPLCRFLSDRMARSNECFLLVAFAQVAASTIVPGAVSFATLGDWGGYGAGGWYAGYQSEVATGMTRMASRANISFVVNVGCALPFPHFFCLVYS